MARRIFKLEALLLPVRESSRFWSAMCSLKRSSRVCRSCRDFGMHGTLQSLNIFRASLLALPSEAVAVFIDSIQNLRIRQHISWSAINFIWFAICWSENAQKGMPIGKLAAAEHCHRVAPEGESAPMAGKRKRHRQGKINFNFRGSTFLNLYKCFNI